jgi:hypothetical protein
VLAWQACSSHWRAANPPPELRTWTGIDDPAERTECALRELYAFYGRTHKIYASLLRDETVGPIVQRLLRDFHAYLRDRGLPDRADCRDGSLAYAPDHGLATHRLLHRRAANS